MEINPIDLREFGGFSTYAEHFLYSGKLDQYLDLVRNKPSRQRSLALMLWKHDTNVGDTTPIGPGMRMPPIGAATWLIRSNLNGKDDVDVYRDYPEVEVRYYGTGLAAETTGDLPAAIESYKHALEVPAKGDLRMLVGHALARVYHQLGKPAEAKEACLEVIAPRMYQTYRALLLPDCLLWSGEAAKLVALWKDATFELPSVKEARSAHP
jgi:hypothetical protein